MLSMLTTEKYEDDSNNTVDTDMDAEDTNSRRMNDGGGRVMRGIAERMNENEIKAVASYIEGLRR